MAQPTQLADMKLVGLVSEHIAPLVSKPGSEDFVPFLLAMEGVLSIAAQTAQATGELSLLSLVENLQTALAGLPNTPPSRVEQQINRLVVLMVLMQRPNNYPALDGPDIRASSDDSLGPDLTSDSKENKDPATHWRR